MTAKTVSLLTRWMRAWMVAGIGDWCSVSRCVGSSEQCFARWVWPRLLLANEPFESEEELDASDAASPGVHTAHYRKVMKCSFSC